MSTPWIYYCGPWWLGGVACPPEHKALLLAAVFMIDYMFFENDPRQKDRRGIGGAAGLNVGPGGMY